MTNLKSHLFLPLAAILIFSAYACTGQQKNNWTPDQLMNPAILAKKIKENKDLPVIISVGPMALIPHSIDIGPAAEEAVRNKLNEALSGYSKKEDIVLYCGCCPFEQCPNIRPAIEVLKEMKFANFHLLNLPTSIKANWIDKEYPTVE